MAINVSRVIDILEKIAADDKNFLDAMREKHGAATFCVECKQNTFTGRHPFWHRYPRSLCDGCRGDYSALLIGLQAYDRF